MSSSMENHQHAAGSSSSSWRRLNANNNNASSSLHDHNRKRKLEDSDEDMFTVPNVEANHHRHQDDNNPMSKSTVTNNGANNAISKNVDPAAAESGIPEKRRRGRNQVDKEYRRLKRLLRNRVSAQQARERKKVYVNDLESRAKELEDANFNLEEKISTLVNENTMLRKVLMNTRPKVDDSVEHK